MKSSTRLISTLIIGVAIGISLAIGHGVMANRSNQGASLPLQELHTFTEVFQKIKTDYVEVIDDKTLLDNAVRGMLSGLDPHSSFLDTESYKELRIGTSGKFGGLGIEVGMEDGFVKVISPIDDTPAQRAGIKAGDLIIRLDETPVKGMTLNDAVQIMRGKPGTDIILTIVREGEDKPLTITVTRAEIKVQSVKSKLLEPGFGYLRITQFQANSGEHLLRQLKGLEKDNKGQLEGLVLDLRNNPGGVLQAAVEVSDAFLEKGRIVYTEGRVSDSKLSFDAHSNDVLRGKPIVVLVNGGSASASEIVAGALQDHKRAIIMGSRTFGKGSVQTIVQINSNEALKLTTARYFTPNGRSIQAEGIVPDIALDKVKVTALENDDMERLKEADLSGHLSNPKDDKGDKKPSDKSAGKDKDKKESGNLATTDYQLYEALNLLKGMRILSTGIASKNVN